MLLSHQCSCGKNKITIEVSEEEMLSQHSRLYIQEKFEEQGWMVSKRLAECPECKAEYERETARVENEQDVVLREEDIQIFKLSKQLEFKIQ